MGTGEGRGAVKQLLRRRDGEEESRSRPMPGFACKQKRVNDDSVDGEVSASAGIQSGFSWPNNK